MESKLNLNFELVEEARAHASKVADDTQRFIDRHTTVAVERTVCRLIKAENEIYEGWTPEEQSVFLRLNRDFMEKLDAWAKTL